MAASLPTDGAKCGGVILFGPEPNGPPLEREGRRSLVRTKTCKTRRGSGGPGEDRGNPPMPKSVESLQGKGFRNARMCSREEENVPLHGTVPVLL
ncbi:hypothetical protein Taro_043336 [Colocasia esculenta]|uniref:Uncharacterized protein n=1 Tax=Colocasia esculenta TaxID=4460 RepID=A0A843WYP9_COLES|nr:hypothetical protein [Colocasia esculenta]